ncbi:unnamed protein product [Vitrella brassicaformis CCMP3155]|uniref:SAC3/GANP/THP3 conserved domain-containing protein n=3 Tax=Vitrella brassicaformis TaxID=1169539 RepID=A0A0G4ECP9_VITBC|nr:unnamed protein product [Vitrella brassicaformis CCMP3155]|eukprot:CEL93750.1 unnamed protein product [Vitrella brassicaformis CCMP3155]
MSFQFFQRSQNVSLTRNTSAQQRDRSGGVSLRRRGSNPPSRRVAPFAKSHAAVRRQRMAGVAALLSSSQAARGMDEGDGGGAPMNPFASAAGGGGSGSEGAVSSFGSIDDGQQAQGWQRETERPAQARRANLRSMPSLDEIVAGSTQSVSAADERPAGTPFQPPSPPAIVVNVSPSPSLALFKTPLSSGRPHHSQTNPLMSMAELQTMGNIALEAELPRPKEALLRSFSTSVRNGFTRERTIGELTAMCSETNARERSTSQTLHELEAEWDANTRSVIKDGNKFRPNLRHAIKPFSRSYAGREFAGTEISTVAWCRKTVDYLMTQVIDLDNYPDDTFGRKCFELTSLYNFIRDRLRSLMQDLQVQDAHKHRSNIETCEIAFRFFIFADQLLCGESEASGFTPDGNVGLMDNCKDRLNQAYSSVRWQLEAVAKHPDQWEHVNSISVYKSPHEAEIHSYILLASLQGSRKRKLNEFLEANGILRKVPRDLSSHPKVKFAMAVLRVYFANDLLKFIKLMKKADFLTACLMDMSLNALRLRQLLRTATAVRRSTKGQKLYTVPIQDFTHMLGFCSTREARRWLERLRVGMEPFLTYCAEHEEQRSSPIMPLHQIRQQVRTEKPGDPSVVDLEDIATRIKHLQQRYSAYNIRLPRSPSPILATRLRQMGLTRKELLDPPPDAPWVLSSSFAPVTPPSADELPPSPLLPPIAPPFTPPTPPPAIPTSPGAAAAEASPLPPYSPISPETSPQEEVEDMGEVRSVPRPDAAARPPLFPAPFPALMPPQAPPPAPSPQKRSDEQQLQQQERVLKGKRARDGDDVAVESDDGGKRGRHVPAAVAETGGKMGTPDRYAAAVEQRRAPSPKVTGEDELAASMPPSALLPLTPPTPSAASRRRPPTPSPPIREPKIVRKDIRKRLHSGHGLGFWGTAKRTKAAAAAAAATVEQQRPPLATERGEGGEVPSGAGGGAVGESEGAREPMVLEISEEAHLWGEGRLFGVNPRRYVWKKVQTPIEAHEPPPPLPPLQHPLPPLPVPSAPPPPPHMQLPSEQHIRDEWESLDDSVSVVGMRVSLEPTADRSKRLRREMNTMLNRRPAVDRRVLIGYIREQFHLDRDGGAFALFVKLGLAIAPTPLAPNTDRSAHAFRTELKRTVRPTIEQWLCSPLARRTTADEANDARSCAIYRCATTASPPEVRLSTVGFDLPQSAASAAAAGGSSMACVALSVATVHQGGMHHLEGQPLEVPGDTEGENGHGAGRSIVRDFMATPHMPLADALGGLSALMWLIPRVVVPYFSAIGESVTEMTLRGLAIPVERQQEQGYDDMSAELSALAMDALREEAERLKAFLDGLPVGERGVPVEVLYVVESADMSAGGEEDDESKAEYGRVWMEHGDPDLAFTNQLSAQIAQHIKTALESLGCADVSVGARCVGVVWRDPLVDREWRDEIRLSQQEVLRAYQDLVKRMAAKPDKAPLVYERVETEGTALLLKCWERHLVDMHRCGTCPPSITADHPSATAAFNQSVVTLLRTHVPNAWRRLVQELASFPHGGRDDLPPIEWRPMLKAVTNRFGDSKTPPTVDFGNDYSDAASLLHHAAAAIVQRIEPSAIVDRSFDSLFDAQGRRMVNYENVREAVTNFCTIDSLLAAELPPHTRALLKGRVLVPRPMYERLFSG